MADIEALRAQRAELLSCCDLLRRMPKNKVYLEIALKAAFTFGMLFGAEHGEVSVRALLNADGKDLSAKVRARLGETA